MRKWLILLLKIPILDSFEVLETIFGLKKGLLCPLEPKKIEIFEDLGPNVEHFGISFLLISWVYPKLSPKEAKKVKNAPNLTLRNQKLGWICVQKGQILIVRGESNA